MFNDELNDEFQKVAFKAGRIEKLQESINQFETELGILTSEKTSAHVKHIREGLKTFDDITPLREFVSGLLGNITADVDVKKHIDEYIEQVDKARKLDAKRGAETTLLIIKLRDYIKKSIQ